MAIDYTLLATAQADALTSAKTNVQNLNRNLATQYLNITFPNWLLGWNNGHTTDKSTAPAPPPAFVVGYFADPTTGPGTTYPTVLQWPYPVAGTVAVCPQPPIPDVPTVNRGSWMIGSAEGPAAPGWFQALTGDVTPSGSISPFPMTSQDGVTGHFEKFGGPAGWGWYFLLP